MRPSSTLERLSSKYDLLIGEQNTLVLGNNVKGNKPLALVFDHDQYGLVLDILSLVKALSLHVHRMVSSEIDELRLLFHHF